MQRCELPKQTFQLIDTTMMIPGDKSMSHRAAILGSLATNASHFENFLCSEDCLNTVTIMKALGVPIEREGTSISIQGVGLNGLSSSNDMLDVGNSGTGIRLLAGLLSAQGFDSVLTGDHSIQSRPMGRIQTPLTQMGAAISGVSSETSICPPLTITGGQSISSIHYDMPIASAQVKSAILLAGLYTEGDVTIIEPAKSRDHTERLFTFYGLDIESDDLTVRLKGHRQLHCPDGGPFYIPADISSALFFMVLQLITSKESCVYEKVGLNPSRIGVLSVLEKMGAKLTIQNEIQDGFEPYGDIVVSSNTLENIHLQGAVIPNVIDEIPILSVLALFSKGRFEVSDAKELRVKESDRIDGVVRLIRSMGGSIEEKEDGFVLEGGQSVSDFDFDSHGDHRLAMSAIVAALGAGVQASVVGCESIATSFPTFFDILSTHDVQFKVNTKGEL
ncbi:3-phosphoshikimate 1-carboxyvinyltransferase [Candidatus Marinamargulisbacteria bacterium SCGC AG-439-L15]|nr:3-phosphoshikimate 1-carboxyvinyltransferase [Candidatus Marinamargulisbacteria bacterium SCGC AG-439-L15]